MPSLNEVLQLTDPSANFNDIPVNFGPALFEIMNGMYDKVGSMEFAIGLSMRTPNAWNTTVELALAAKAKLGDRLDTMILGNVSLYFYFFTLRLGLSEKANVDRSLIYTRRMDSATPTKYLIMFSLSFLFIILALTKLTRFLKSLKFWVICTIQVL